MMLAAAQPIVALVMQLKRDKPRRFRLVVIPFARKRSPVAPYSLASLQPWSLNIVNQSELPTHPVIPTGSNSRTLSRYVKQESHD